MNEQPRKPRRLEQIFQSYDSPIYFITFCTYDRNKLLSNEQIHSRFQEFALKSQDHGAAIGRYVIMPDHIHLFVRIAPQLRIGNTIRLLKRSLSSVMESPLPHWQPGFFDHIVRHSESYSEKWAYVYHNPVRAGLVEKPEDWPYQGEVVSIRY
jgi:REP element-mobilizing transposase RayT